MYYADSDVPFISITPETRTGKADARNGSVV